MDDSDLLAEVMRRVEANWGDSASEGPYARQEIVSDMREILAEVAALPPCACIKVEGCYLTNACLLHNPADGLLVEQPVQFTGLLSVLGRCGDTPEEEGGHADDAR